MTETVAPEPTPEQAALFARVRRLMLIAGLTTALAVAAVLIAAGDATSPVSLHVPGGVLDVIWKPGERATLVGDAVREFEPYQPYRLDPRAGARGAL